MPVHTVKNKRLKMSPGGVVDLPVAARKTLGLKPGAGGRVHVSVDGGSVVVASASDASGGVRISPKGMLTLRGDAYNVLSSGAGRHYYIEADDAAGHVKLCPFAS